MCESEIMQQHNRPLWPGCQLWTLHTGALPRDTYRISRYTKGSSLLYNSAIENSIQALKVSTHHVACCIVWNFISTNIHSILTVKSKSKSGDPFSIPAPCPVQTLAGSRCPHLVTRVMWEGLGMAFSCLMWYLSWYQLCSLLCSVDGISKPVQYQYLPSVQQRPFCRCHPGEIFSHNHFFLLFGENLFRNFYLGEKLMLPTNGRNSSLKAQVGNIVPAQVS